jgi:hypothetical protein
MCVNKISSELTVHKYLSDTFPFWSVLKENALLPLFLSDAQKHAIREGLELNEM